MVIVLGYTDRPESAEALNRAVDEAKLRKAKLYVVQVPAERPGENPSQAKAWLERVEHLRREGAELEKRLKAQGIDAAYHLVPEPSGTPAQGILDVADEEGADLIVIGLRHRSPVGKLVMGSVSQDVMLRAECPVLAVKAPATPS